MKQVILFIGMTLFAMNSCGQKVVKEKNSYFRYLTKEEERVILHKGTERPFSGKYDHFYEDGMYVCKRCGAALYRSSDKFNSGCGWPSFDDEIEGAVKQTPDPDGMRTEITCNKCGAHLGHVFLNEGFTAKNTRHCVNSVSLEFIPSKTNTAAGRDTAYFAGGCFWGVEYMMEQVHGVLSVESGYMGGSVQQPTYQLVCEHTTGHAEAVQVVFDPMQINYEQLARLFFEIHDPTQFNRQGPDVGAQYRSAVFYRSVKQKETAEKLIAILKDKGFKVVTRVSPAGLFWKAEDYHQDYYRRKGSKPYCHYKVKRFES